MSTRYIYGFMKDCKRKYTYGHYDGYPDGVGLDLKKELSKYSVEFMRARFDKFIVCESSEIPEKITVQELLDKNYININKINSKLITNKKDLFNCDWYTVLREWQGTIIPLMEYDTPYMIYADEYSDHEYRYTIDLDNAWYVIDHHSYKSNDYNEIITIPLMELDEMSDDEYCRKIEEACQ